MVLRSGRGIKENRHRTYKSHNDTSVNFWDDAKAILSWTWCFKDLVISKSARTRSL